MSRYLKQTAQYEAVIHNEKGEPQLNEYGEPIYKSVVTVKCRREQYKAKATTSYGQFVDYSHTYYLDESIKPQIDDKLDGELIKNVEKYVDGTGTLVGYEVHV